MLTAAILLVSAAMIRRLPGVIAQPSESQPAEARPSAAGSYVPQGRPAIRNAGFVVTSFFDGLLSSSCVHRLVLSLLPAGTAVTSIQLHASHDTWHRRLISAACAPQNPHKSGSSGLEPTDNTALSGIRRHRC